MTKTGWLAIRDGFLRFDHSAIWSFGFVSDFEFRASNLHRRVSFEIEIVFLLDRISLT